MAKVATIEPWSNAFCKLPAREKCWKAKYPAITNDIMEPSRVPLPMENTEKNKNKQNYKWSDC